MTDTTAELRARIEALDFTHAKGIDRAVAYRALCFECLHRAEKYRIEAHTLTEERDAARTELEALRVAVGQLADQLADEAAFRPETPHGDGIVKTKRNAARRLRSLIVQEEQKEQP